MGVPQVLDGDGNSIDSFDFAGGVAAGPTWRRSPPRRPQAPRPPRHAPPDFKGANHRKTIGKNPTISGNSGE